MGAFDQQFAETSHDQVVPQPQPLTAPVSTQGAYPVDELGSLLGGAVKSTVERTDVPVSIAAQSILAAVSLAQQGHFDVMLPTGQRRPICLFMVTVADSGDRKSTADDYVSSSIREFEQELERRHASERVDAQNAQAAWDESRKAVTHANKSRGKAALEDAYRDLGPRPEGPLEPTLIVRTGTTQGLLKRFMHTRPALGLMSDEGGSWLGGYGMTEDNRLNTISTLSDFWDGKTIQTLTAGEGYTPLRGRRLTFHMMVQPVVASRLLGSSEALGQGFLSRLLVCHPASLAGTRFRDPNRVFSDELTAAMNEYNSRLSRIVRTDLPTEQGGMSLSPKAIELEYDAKAAWWDFYNLIEGRLGPDGDLQSIKGFVGKLPEQAARIAANIAIFEQGYRLNRIDAFTMARGIRIAEFYMSEALRLFGNEAPSVRIQHAQVLSDWLRDCWDENFVSVQAITQRAPRAIRKGGDYVRDLIDVLVRHDHLSPPLPGGGHVTGKKCNVVWRVLVKKDAAA